MSETLQRPKIEYVIFDMDGESVITIPNHLLAKRCFWMTVYLTVNRSTHRLGEGLYRCHE